MERFSGTPQPVKSRLWLVFKRNLLKYCCLGLVGKRNQPSNFTEKIEEWLVAQTPLTYESFLGHAQESSRLPSKFINSHSGSGSGTGMAFKNSGSGS